MLSISFKGVEKHLKMLDDQGKRVAKSGRCINTFWGVGNYLKKGSTMTGDIATGHIYGRGRLPKRDPLGFDDVITKHIKFVHRRVVTGVLDTEKGLNEIGQFITRRFLMRLAKGVDSKGRAFKPYSEGYKKIRKERQRQTGRVDLTDTGIMKESFRHEVFMR